MDDFIPVKIHPSLFYSSQKGYKKINFSDYNVSFIDSTKKRCHTLIKKDILVNAFKQASPIIFGYVPIGFAYGVLSQEAGLSMQNTMIMSLIVFAGSSQFIAVGLFPAGITPVSIIITTFIVNLRHALMSASLSPIVKTWNKTEIAAFAFEITDETFAVHSLRYNEVENIDNNHLKIEMLLINLIAQCSWVLGSWLGCSMGQLISNVKAYGLDFALPAMFIALIIMQVNNLLQVVLLIFAGIISTSLLISGIDQWNVILATIVCATIGACVEKWIKK